LEPTGNTTENLTYHPVSLRNAGEAIEAQKDIFPDEDGTLHILAACDNNMFNLVSGIDLAIGKGDFYLAAAGNDIVGLTGLYTYRDTGKKGECWLAWFGVRGRFRGHGYGREILEWTIKKAAEEGYEILRLYTSGEYAHAIALYEELGFSGERYAQEFDGMLIYSISLTGGPAQPLGDRHMNFAAEVELCGIPGEKKKDIMEKMVGVGVYDVVLSYGAESKEGHAVKAEIKDPLCLPKIINEVLTEEVEHKIRKYYEEKVYIGSREFRVCKSVGGGEGCDVTGHIYITAVKPPGAAEPQAGGKGKGKKGADNSINDIVLVDVVFMGVPRAYIAALHEQAQCRSPALQGTPDKKGILDELGLDIITPPKSVVFAYGPKLLGPRELTGIMIHEADDNTDYSDICSAQAADYVNENISNYKSIFITASDCNITHQFLNGLEQDKRIENLALTIFIANVVVNKIAKLRLIQKALYNCLDEAATKEKLLNISRHIAELEYIWHENTFTYPLTAIMARKIYSRFRIDELKAELSDIKQAFESYMSMLINREEERNEKSRKNILETLTMLSGTMLIVNISQFFFDLSDIFRKISVFAGGTLLVALIVYILPSLIRRKKK
jgi:GNAT superfamily N-acetyltransferase